MAQKDYAWYGDWMHDHYQPWIDHQKRTSDAWDTYMKASDYALNYLGGRTAGTQDEFEEAMRRYEASDAASARWNALIQQDTSFDEGAKVAFEDWSNSYKTAEAPFTDNYFADLQGAWTQEQLDSIDPRFLNPDVQAGDPIQGSLSIEGNAFRSGQDTEKSIQTLQRETAILNKKPERFVDDSWVPTETRPAGTNSIYEGDRLNPVPFIAPFVEEGLRNFLGPQSKDTTDTNETQIADAGIPRTADWTGESRPPAPESGYKWYPTNNPDDPGGGFWSPDLNHEKWKVENLGGELGQIASAGGLESGMLPAKTVRT